MTILRRDFGSYSAYVEAQGRKAKYKRRDLLVGDGERANGFEQIFREAASALNPGSLLCLGARTGAEVVAAKRVGFDAVGIDLHPVTAIVRRGDWHAMPEFADGSFQNAYTNSLDHCLHLDLLVAEVRRILPVAGAFYVMASDRGTKDAQRERSWLKEPKHNETLYWSHSDALRDAILDLGGFAVRKAWRKGQWGHYVFEKR